MHFFYCWYVSEFSHLLARLLLFIISVYLEKNIFIIQLFLIIWVSGSLFKLCLKGSPMMYLLHVLKILWVLVKNVHKKSSILGSKFDARRRLECKMLHHLPQTPSRNTTSLCEVGDPLRQSFNSPITFVFSPTTQKINDIPVNYIPKYLQIFHLLVK